MAELREITAGLRFPEGPVAMPDGSVLLVEIAAGRLTRVAPDGTKTTVSEIGAGPNGAAIGPDGRCWICNNGGFKWHEEAGTLRPVLQADDYSGGRIEAVDLATGAVERIYDRAGAFGLRGPNDLVFDAHGGVWFTDLGKARARDMDRGAVYYARADGSLIREVIQPMVTPNGIGLSPDGRTLYVAETEPGRLWAFDVTAPGEIRKLPWPSPHGGRLVVGLDGFQRFDSLAVQADGAICVATLMSGRITIVDPDGGNLRFVEMPEPYPTNICFGGPDRKTAYITLSMTGRLVAMDWPVPGAALNWLDRRP
ncbi:SMP-30/gluconolactonase/LRE family protein [Stella sp.]|uniref:SMP-30/gluconolactonase/LRE family protein n=1 Tax=Stella sp. TaxID=2912054 RepID=UPI0035AF6E0D